jgi:hypothetical protein
MTLDQWHDAAVQVDTLVQEIQAMLERALAVREELFKREVDLKDGEEEARSATAGGAV